MRDWAEFFSRAGFGKEKEDILLQLLVNRTLCLNMEDRAVYDALVAEVLTGEELKQFIAYRDDVPIRHWVAEAGQSVRKDFGADLGSDARNTVERVVRAAPLNHDAIWHRASEAIDAKVLRAEDLPAIEREARHKFEQAMQSHGQTLTPSQRLALQRWFEERVLASNMRALRRGLHVAPP